jgi:uncharacterized membrane protein
MGKLKQFWADLRSSLWFLPLLIVAGMVALAFGLIELDQSVHRRLISAWPRFFADDPEGARAMLSAIAGSMITVAGVVFSITIVALAQTSTQYSPRVLRNFMRDRSNQSVLGTFVGIFAYCLVVLRNITGAIDNAFFPSLATLVGFVLALLGISFLIFFIHHIATSIQASEMIAAITSETIRVLNAMFPEKAQPHLPPEENSPAMADVPWQVVPATSTGYVQRIENARLLHLARERNVCLRMECGIGEFVIAGQPLVSVSGLQPDHAFIRAINANYGIDSYRTVDQDPAFGVRQIVDIALKALSPGINDTGTALTCIDYLSAIFSRMASLRLEQPSLSDEAATRLILKRITFQDLLRDSYEQILHNAAGNKVIFCHLLHGLERIGASECHPSRKPILAAQVDNIIDIAQRTISIPSVLAPVQQRAQQVKAALTAVE